MYIYANMPFWYSVVKLKRGCFSHALSTLFSLSISVTIWTCFDPAFRVHRHTIGDSKVPFCLQSCVKPLKYAIAVNDHGTEYVHSFIGKEPSGLRFNKLFLNEDGEPPRF